MEDTEIYCTRVHLRLCVQKSYNVIDLLCNGKWFMSQLAVDDVEEFECLN